MKLIPQFERLNSGENNSRTVKISVGSEYGDKDIKIGFITPKGKVFITDDISLTDGEGEYKLPYELLDGKGLLLSQLIVYEGEKFIIKSPVYEFPVYRSVDDEDCPCVTSEGIKSLAFLYELICSKSDKGHIHNDIYYTETETDAFLSEKSDKGHSHNDIYYTESETDALLAERAHIVHNHDDAYCSRNDVAVMVSQKSDKSHNHDGLYASKEDYINIKDSKSDIGHVHSWYEIENKPGTEGAELILPLTLDEMSHDFMNNRWSQSYFEAPQVALAENIRVRIRLKGSEDFYEKDCEVLSPDGVMYAISFNNAAFTSENIADGTFDFTPVPLDSSMPSFLIFAMPGDSCEVFTDKDYTGAYIEITRITFVKLGNEALYVTDEVTKDSDSLITAGGVYEALSAAGEGAMSDALENYYTRDEADALFEGKSNSDHLHDDRYYTEDETDELLAGKSDAVHNHDDVYCSRNDVAVMLSQKSDKSHNHDGLYASKEDYINIKDSKSDIGHVHSWYEIENKPGTEGAELILPLTLDEMSHDFMNNRWSQSYFAAPQVALAENIRVRIRLKGSEDFYEKDCEVLSPDGVMYAISFNNAAFTRENIADGTFDFTPVPLDSSMPSFLIFAMPGDSCEVFTDKDYTGAYIEITRINLVKLGNEALYVTDEVTKDSDSLITAGGVYEALSSAGTGAVSSVNGKTGAVNLTASDVGALPDSTSIPTVPQNISAFNNDTGYIKSTDIDSIPVMGSDKPVSSGGVYEALSAAGEGAINDALENYYTRDEADALFVGKSNSDHLHDDRYYTESEIDGFLTDKAEKNHSHNDIYYTETEVNELLSQKSDKEHLHDDRYYTEDETDELLAGKSDAVHNHDDAYCSRNDVAVMLSEKSDKSHNHDDAYCSRNDVAVMLSEKSDKSHNHDDAYCSRNDVAVMLSAKSDKSHNHDELYSSKADVSIIRESKSDIGHGHNWYEIENKPGTEGSELVLPLTLDELSRDYSDNRWTQFFYTSPDVILSEILRVRIRLNGSESFYERDCKVLTPDGFMYGISFNNAAFTEDNIDNGTYDFTPVPADSGVPSFLMFMVPGDSCEVFTDKDYTGAYIEITRRTFVKLGNEAIDITSEVQKGSNLPVTSGGVFEALSSAGAGSVKSVNGKTGSITLTASDLGADTAGSAARVLNEAKAYTDSKSFIINAKADLATLSVTQLSKTFEEISAASANEQNVRLCLDMTQYKVILPLTVFSEGAYVVFESVLAMDERPAHISIYILADNSVNAQITQL